MLLLLLPLLLLVLVLFLLLLLFVLLMLRDGTWPGSRPRVALHGFDRLRNEQEISLGQDLGEPLGVVMLRVHSDE